MRKKRSAHAKNTQGLTEKFNGGGETEKGGEDCEKKGLFCEILNKMSKKLGRTVAPPPLPLRTVQYSTVYAQETADMPMNLHEPPLSYSPTFK